MKVAIGEMKTHLSRYIRELQSGAEPIEVCVRETTVAYLSAPDSKTDRADERSLRRVLEAEGLHVSQWGEKPAGPLPSPAGPPGADNAVVEMRRSKAW